ncbi:MAG: recombinase family protein [Balneolaceae bacterium]
MKKQKIPKVYSYVRISTSKQKDGDGIRRQTEDIDYKGIAKKLGLPLDTDLDLIDKGLSGFSGAHRIKGALGLFEKAIEEGKIAKGSVLVIEMLDRLTRQVLLEAVHLMTGILLKGVGIYTAVDEKFYTQDSFDFGQLVLSANILQTGHEESLKKKVRGKANWKAKRNEARRGGNKLTAICPMWLEPVKNEKGETSEFKIKNDIAAQVQMIFKLKLEGLGNKRIANMLEGNWAESTIQRYTHDRRVLGEFQPYTKNHDEREAVGEPIKDIYYPRIVEDELFYAVQNKMKEWQERQGYKVGRNGRNGKHSNIFVKIVKCGECGGAMHYDNKGDTSKGGKFLRCYNAKRSFKDEDGNRVCEARGIRYEEFFQIFFKYIDEVDVNELTRNNEDIEIQLDEIELQLLANKYRLREFDEYEANLVDTIASTGSPDVRKKLEEKLESMIQDHKECQLKIETLTTTASKLQREEKTIKETRENLLIARDYLDSAETEEELISKRIKLHQLVCELINEIKIYPLNERYKRNEIHEEDAYIQVHMESRYINRFRVVFNTHEKHIANVYLKRFREKIED